MNIVLTGFMATGKTTVGKKIAAMSDYELIDTDEMIVSRENRSINDIFAENGEDYFRRVEYEAICSAARMDGKVISTGGGAVLNARNIDALRGNGVIFNLNPEFSVIERHIRDAAATRPLMREQSIADIKKRFDDRKPFYDNCDYKIDITSDSTPEDTARKILDLMNKTRRTRSLDDKISRGLYK